MPTRITFSLLMAALVFTALTLSQVVDPFYREWRGDNLQSTIVGATFVGAFVISGYFAIKAVFRKKYPKWDGRTLAKSATSKADRDITRTKLFLVLVAFGLLATLLWGACLTVYANNFEEGSVDTGPGIAWLAALPVANYMAYRASKAVLRRKHPTWNGKIPSRQRALRSHASAE